VNVVSERAMVTKMGVWSGEDVHLPCDPLYFARIFEYVEGKSVNGDLFPLGSIAFIHGED